MSKENKSTFGERMQGPKHEGDAMMALGILNGDISLGDAMADSDFADCNFDWDFVKRYIAAHRHEFPDYKD